MLVARTAIDWTVDIESIARPSKHHEDAPKVQFYYSTFMAYFPYAILEVYFYARKRSKAHGTLYPCINR